MASAQGHQGNAGCSYALHIDPITPALVGHRVLGRWGALAARPGARDTVAAHGCLGYPHLPGGLQRHHPHPEHGLVANLDIILTGERQRAVLAHAEDGQTGGKGLDRVTLPYLHGQIVLRDQQAATGIQMKRTRMDGPRVDVLDRFRSPVA